MSGKARRQSMIVTAALVFGLAAAGATYFLQQQKLDRLEAVRQVQTERINDLEAENDSLRAQVAESSAAASAAQAATQPEEELTSPAEKTPAPKSVRQFAFVTKATRSGGDIKLTLDYAEFLTGDAAATAAAAAGDESPPPNDYYISNTNTKLRVLPVASTAEFTVAGGDPTDTTVLSADQFVDAVVNNTDGAADVAYWFTVRSGVVTGGEEQWTP